MKTSVRFRRVQCGVAGLLLGLPWVQASAADAPAETPDEIVVTGTRFHDRTALDTPVPVDVLSADELRQSGAFASELGQALQTLAPSFNFPRQSNSGGADHVRAAQLRGMSPDQVLVLVNGKRRHTSAVVQLESKIGKGTTPVDFNSIPLNAIKRIEILRDGAGALYGSDAIAGVINVILEDAPEGSEVSATYGTHRTDFEPSHQTLTDGGTVVVAAKTGFRLLDSGFLRFGAEYKDRQATNRAGLDLVPFFEEQTPDNLALAGRRNYHPGDPDARDLNLWVNSSLPLADTLDLYGFATYNDRDSTGAAFFRYPDGAANVREVYPNGYRPSTTGKNRDLSVTAGVRGDSTPWQWDASLTYGRNKFEYGVEHSLNSSLGPDSSTSFHLGDFIFDQLTANVDVTRQFTVSALAAPVNFAFGAEYRDERFETRAGDPASYAAGPFLDKLAGAQAGPGLSPEDEADSSRHVASLYVDVAANLTSALLLDAAVRFEDYSDFGSAVAGKLSARYEISPAFALRAAVSNSFRAPSLSQISHRFTVTNLGEGGALSSVLTLPVADPIARALGARDLDPEKSVNFSIGFTGAPAENFTLSVDLFQIRLKDRITLSERISGSDLTDFIEENFDVTGIDGVNFFTNAVDTKTRGVDLVVSHEKAFTPGTLKLTAAFTYAKTTIDGVDATPQQLIDLGFNDVLFGVEERNTLVDAAPRTKALLTANWIAPRWSLLGRLTRYGSAVRVFNFGDGFEPRQKYGSKLQLDLEGEWQATQSLSLTLGASNLLDTYPDRSSGDINYFGNFPYDVLSPIGMNGAYFYGGARLRF